MYLSIAMADIAFETRDEALARACERLWESATTRRMYITGGIGSSARQEAFSSDFDLPNDTAYAETCAAIGLFFFANRMARLRHDARYADVMERTLFNGILSGLALDGRSYFYVNPLEVNPEICDRNPTYRHVKYRRQPWYGCACCPPNIARTIASLGEYVYHLGEETLYADLFHQGSIRCAVGGKEVSLRQTTAYPWGETTVFEPIGGEPAEFDLAVRLPGWCARPSLTLNGSAMELAGVRRDGYAHVRRVWRRGDRLELALPMPVDRVHADPRVRADWGKVAIQRGPIVYCLEQIDHGPHLHTLALPPGETLHVEHRANLLGGVSVITATGLGWDGKSVESVPYRADAARAALNRRPLLFVPYYAWANREPGEMTVWIREQEGIAVGSPES